VNLRRSGNGIKNEIFEAQPAPIADRYVLGEESFHRMISVERKRTERSRKPFLLMLLDTGTNHSNGGAGKTLSRIVSTLLATSRETDVTGWYKSNAVVGVMFTELGMGDRNSILSAMLARISETLRDNLTAEQFNQISISFHLFPEDWDCETPQRPSNPALYPDLERRDDSRKFFCVVKRFMDIVGSLLAIVLFSPLFVLLSLAIKLTSKGPIFYSQRRVGQYGIPFRFLKFRSMYVGNDASKHKEYVTRMIAGTAERKPSNGNGEAVYKLTDDPRITPIGRFLRRTSLDELPQFFNVLTGQMSLVGPRPPINYEVEAYDLWHRRRVLEAKPGITGLWQVNGRNRIKFDEMVRLDLAYARTWSPWLDIKILLRTPRAMAEGAH
jgi:lipopolysaccharide/colanic/teichoic acid biosynthesis glycosyltransferase